MKDRILAHQKIRDDILEVLHQYKGVKARPTDGGSYLFVDMPELDISISDYCAGLRKLADVTVTPGTEFGPQFTHHFRINFSQDHDAAVAAIKRAMEIMERYRKN